MKQLDFGLEVGRKVTEKVAWNLLKDLLEPGTPGLGGFGWYQPEDENGEVKLGSVYGQYDAFTLREVLEDAGLKCWELKTILRAAKEEGVGLDTRIEPDGIASIEEVFTTLGELSKEEQALTKLKIAVVNFGHETHNWACEYGDALAADYVPVWDTWEPYEETEYPNTLQELYDFGVLVPAFAYEGDYSLPKTSREIDPESAASLFPDLKLDPDKHWMGDICQVIGAVIDELLEAFKPEYIDWAEYDAQHPEGR